MSDHIKRGVDQSDELTMDDLEDVAGGLTLPTMDSATTETVADADTTSIEEGADPSTWPYELQKKRFPKM